EYQESLKKQFEQFVREQAKLNELLVELLRESGNEDETAVKEKLRAADPLMRWVAIQLVGKKWMPLEKDLIGLLADPMPGVRDAARQALVRLSRGSDFGPL